MSVLYNYEITIIPLLSRLWKKQIEYVAELVKTLYELKSKFLLKMGNTESSSARDYRTYNVPIKLPMPEPGELDNRFLKVLVSV